MRRRRTRVGAGALALALVGCGGEDEPTALEAACNGRTELLVTSQKLTDDQDGASSLLLTHAASDTVDVLTGIDVVASDPTFSPAGDQVAFVRADAGGYESAGPFAESIWTVAIDGTGLTQLTGGEGWEQQDPGVHDTDPQWSPDGSLIAFARRQATPDGGTARPASGQIYVVEPGGEPRPLVPNDPNGLDSAPAWSTDGSQVAFLRREAAFSRKPVLAVWVAAADGTGARRVAEVPDATTIAWNPDDASLLVSGRPRPGDPGLRRVELADGKVTALTTGYYPVWSDDGTTLYLFTLVTGSGHELRITTVTRDGDRLSDVRQAQDGHYRDTGPDLGLDVVSCLVGVEDG